MGWDIILRVYEFAEVFAVEWQRCSAYRCENSSMQLARILLQLQWATPTKGARAPLETIIACGLASTIRRTLVFTPDRHPLQTRLPRREDIAAGVFPPSLGSFGTFFYLPHPPFARRRFPVSTHRPTQTRTPLNCTFFMS